MSTVRELVSFSIGSILSDREDHRGRDRDADPRHWNTNLSTLEDGGEAGYRSQDSSRSNRHLNVAKQNRNGSNANEPVHCDRSSHLESSKRAFIARPPPTPACIQGPEEARKEDVKTMVINKDTYVNVRHILEKLERGDDIVLGNLGISRVQGSHKFRVEKMPATKQDGMTPPLRKEALDRSELKDRRGYHQELGLKENSELLRSDLLHGMRTTTTGIRRGAEDWRQMPDYSQARNGKRHIDKLLSPVEVFAVSPNDDLRDMIIDDADPFSGSHTTNKKSFPTESTTEKTLLKSFPTSKSQTPLAVLKSYRVRSSTNLNNARTKSPRDCDNENSETSARKSPDINPMKRLLQRFQEQNPESEISLDPGSSKEKPVNGLKAVLSDGISREREINPRISFGEKILGDRPNGEAERDHSRNIEQELAEEKRMLERIEHEIYMRERLETEKRIRQRMLEEKRIRVEEERRRLLAEQIDLTRRSPREPRMRGVEDRKYIVNSVNDDSLTFPGVHRMLTGLLHTFEETNRSLVLPNTSRAPSPVDPFEEKSPAAPVRKSCIVAPRRKVPPVAADCLEGKSSAIPETKPNARAEPANASQMPPLAKIQAREAERSELTRMDSEKMERDSTEAQRLDTMDRLYREKLNETVKLQMLRAERNRILTMKMDSERMNIRRSEIRETEHFDQLKIKPERSDTRSVDILLSEMRGGVNMNERARLEPCVGRERAKHCVERERMEPDRIEMLVDEEFIKHEALEGVDQVKQELQQDLCEDQVARSSRSNSSDSAESKSNFIDGLVDLVPYGIDKIPYSMEKVPYSVDQIINCSSEQFIILMKRSTLTNNQVAICKDIRRRGKNKIAAQNCRKRKQEHVDRVQQEIHQLRKRVKLERDTNQKLARKEEALKRKLQCLSKAVLLSSGSIKPNQFSSNQPGSSNQPRVSHQPGFSKHPGNSSSSSSNPPISSKSIHLPASCSLSNQPLMRSSNPPRSSDHPTTSSSNQPRSSNRPGISSSSLSNQLDTSTSKQVDQMPIKEIDNRKSNDELTNKSKMTSILSITSDQPDDINNQPCDNISICDNPTDNKSQARSPKICQTSSVDKSVIKSTLDQSFALNKITTDAKCDPATPTKSAEKKIENSANKDESQLDDEDDTLIIDC